MGMPAQQQDLDWTVERAHALPDDGNRYEVLDGELFVTPAPIWRHQTAVGLLYSPLVAYALEQRIGWAVFAPADVIFAPRRLLQPDIFVVPWRDLTAPNPSPKATRLLLAVEVLSPSTARADRQRKRAIYQDEGVPEYWIVDVDARLIERWRPGDERPEIVTARLEWQPRAAHAPLELDLVLYFDAVHGWPTA